MSDEGTGKSTALTGLRIVLVASLLLFLLATLTETYRTPSVPETLAPTPTQKFSQDNLIIPGTRVGPVTLGLPIGTVITELGKGQKRPAETGVFHLYQHLGLVIYTENDIVSSVNVSSEIFTTRQGVKVGSDVDAVLSTLGEKYEMEGEQDKYVLHNWSRGWHVGVENNKVTFLRVTPALEPTTSSADSPLE